MTRRRNSLLLPSPEEEDPTNELVIEELEFDPPALPAPEPTAQLALAGLAADQAAAKKAFARYQARLSPNSRRQQAVTLAAWHDYLAAAGVSAPSVEALMNDAMSWASVTWGLVEGFSQWLLQAGYAIATVNARLSTIRAYCHLAHKVGVLDQGNYSRIRLVRGYTRKEGRNIDQEREVTRKGDKKAEWTRLSDQQAEQLKAQPRATPQGRRDALLMCLLLDHGLRCGEVAALRAQDFDLARGTFSFYREKVDLTQTHRLTDDTLQAAQAYLRLDVVGKGPLLRGSRKDGNLTEGAMTARSITRRVQVLGEQLGIEQLSAHDCRHYWATDAVRNGSDIKVLQDAGGWSSPAMPLRYADSNEIANEGLKQGKDKKQR